MLERRRVIVSRSKTEYMCMNERDSSGTVRLQEAEVEKAHEFKHLRSTVQSNRECWKEAKKQVQAGWRGWRKKEKQRFERNQQSCLIWRRWH